MAAKRAGRSGAAKKGARGKNASKSSTRKNPTEGAPEANVPPTRATGVETATGTAIAEAQRDDIPKGEDRGSKVEIVGGPPEADYLSDGSQKNPQDEEPAVFSSNGQILPGTVGSPSGPVPASAAAAYVPGGAQAGVKLSESPSVEAQKEFNARRAEDRATRTLDENTVNRLSAAELRAIGQQRGYDMPDPAGNRVTRAAFLRFQNEEKSK